MFGKLRNKIGGFFKKKPSEEVEEEKPKKEKKKVVVKREESVVEKKVKEIKKKKKADEKLIDAETVRKSSRENISHTSEETSDETLSEDNSEDFEEEDTSVKGGVVEREEVKEEEDIENVTSGGGFFSKLAKNMTTSALKEDDFNEFFDEFEMVLLESNVALEVVDKIRESLKNSLVGRSFKKKEVKEKILEALKNSIELVLVEGDGVVERAKKFGDDRPFVVLFFGINGSGKTTSVAKLAWKLKNEGISVVMAAADTFRAASIEQLKTHGERIGVDVVAADYGADPASVAFDAIQYASKHKKKVVLIDTAGRMYTRANLMREMEKVVRVSKPDMKIFVGESITGNDATEQAKMFNETAGIDGCILSKADIDEKAGTILSVGYVTGKPILYLGVGQEYKDLRRFSKEDVFKGLGLS